MGRLAHHARPLSQSTANTILIEDSHLTASMECNTRGPGAAKQMPSVNIFPREIRNVDSGGNYTTSSRREKMRCFPSFRLANRWAVACCALAIVGLSSLANAEGPTDYAKAGDLSGTLTSIGSDTLLNQMNFWAEEFNKMYPNVTFQIEGKGTATAPPALTEGKALLGPSSRKWKPEEEDAFEAKQ